MMTYNNRGILQLFDSLNKDFLRHFVYKIGGKTNWCFRYFTRKLKYTKGNTFLLIVDISFNLIYMPSLQKKQNILEQFWINLSEHRWRPWPEKAILLYILQSQHLKR